MPLCGGLCNHLWRACLLVTAVSVVACVAFEWLYCKLLKKANPISDLSAVVTGIILAMNVPVGMPIGQLIIGDLVASSWSSSCSAALA
mgnify:CR=1 FL=1